MKYQHIIFFVFITLLSASSAFAASPCSVELGELPVLAEGRVMPLEVRASQTLKFMTGKATPLKEDPVITYCRLSFSQQNPDDAILKELFLKTGHVQVREILGLNKGVSTISPDQVLEKLQGIQNHVYQLEQNGGNRVVIDELKALLAKTQLFYELSHGGDWKVPVGDQWLALGEIWEGTEAFAPNPSAVIDVIQQYGQAFRQQNPHYLVELTYHRLHLLHMALLAAMVALVLGFVLKNPHHPMTVSVLSLLFFLQAAMVVFRVLIAGRAPVTNMYETVLWVGLGALVFGGLLGWWRRERLFLLFGVLINLVSLFMMMFADRMLDPTLKPLAPVLRDNFWLATHVTTITISYAAFGLSWLIANYYMIKGIASKIGYEEGKHLNEMTYDCLRIGVVLLSAGILLGAVWADYSWGRFWGWDPKETWSLVALMAYLAVLHGRYAGWIGDESFLPYVALAFLTIVIAWFGVNYVLASGLHSYGFSRGGATAILALIMAQIILFLLWKIRKIF